LPPPCCSSVPSRAFRSDRRAGLREWVPAPHLASVRANAHPPRTFAQLPAINGVGGLLGAEIARSFAVARPCVRPQPLGGLGASHPAGFPRTRIWFWREGARCELESPIGLVWQLVYLPHDLSRDDSRSLSCGGSTFDWWKLRLGREAPWPLLSGRTLAGPMFLASLYAGGAAAGAPDSSGRPHLLLLHSHPKYESVSWLGYGGSPPAPPLTAGAWNPSRP